MTLPSEWLAGLTRALADRYRIEREIGQGGMATVYLAEDLKHRRRVAIKVLNPDVAADIGPERFLREIEIAARLSHPHIVPLHDSGATDGQLYYVMPFIEGESLRARLGRERRLALDDALRLGREIASALGFAHAQGLVHRDIKPENVLIAHGIAMVADFGIARSARPGVDASLTQLGSVVGTPHYMSPEQAAGTANVDGRSDLYALGCVLHEMLAGEPPFTGPHAAMILAKHALEPPPSVRVARPDVPESIDRVLRLALAKNPDERPASAARFAEALSVSSMTASTPTPTSRLDPAIPTNLRRQRTGFVGREVDRAEAAALLVDTRLLTLTGIGGCGKSRLALELAHDVFAEFPGGVWVVDLAGVTDAGQVAPQLVRTLGLADEAGQDAVATVVSHLRDRRALIVLDNGEQQVAACAALVDAVIAGSVEARVIATSRERLGVDGERVVKVRTLSVPDAGAMDALAAAEASEAVQLFVARTRQILPNFELTSGNAAAIAEICRSLDGLPLAIELAAARMMVLTPDAIRDRLEDRFRLLTSGNRSALPRHQTLLAAIQWSHDQLAEPEQRLFAMLSVFAGGWSLEGACAIAGEGRDDFEVLDLLAKLVDKSLVVVEHAGVNHTRYRMLESVRRFAAAQLDESSTLDLRRRHFAWYLKCGEQAHQERRKSSADQGAANRWLSQEYENLMAALERYLADTIRSGEGLRLALVVSDFCAGSGHFAEGRRVALRALEQEESAVPVATVVTTLRSTGNLAFRQADYDGAVQLYRRSLELARAVNDMQGVAGALGSLGNVAHYIGQHDEAQRLFEETTAVARANGFRQFEANSLTCLGNVVKDRGDHAAAKQLLEQSLAINMELGIQSSIANVLDNLSILLSTMGEHAAARSTAERALIAYREMSDPFGQASTMVHLAQVMSDGGDQEEAGALIRTALPIVRTLNDPRLMYVVIHNAARVAVRQRQFERAARLLAAGEALGGERFVDVEYHRRRDAMLSTLRDELGAGFDDARRAGEALTMEGAVALIMADATD